MNQKSERRAVICVNGVKAGVLAELERQKSYSFTYDEKYSGAPISLTMPVRSEPYRFRSFPPFFDGLLPEGVQLDALLRARKIDRDDVWRQLLAVGADLVGNVTVVAENEPAP